MRIFLWFHFVLSMGTIITALICLSHAEYPRKVTYMRWEDASRIFLAILTLAWIAWLLFVGKGGAS